MAAILKREYTPSELEDRLGITMEDLQDGLELFVDTNYDEVLTLLREDLWFD